MAVTRINNNQITDAASGNVYVGINAGTKLQAYSITATRIANNLTYGSDLTVTGNLTVQGTTTAIDTVNTLIQDPLITLADGQTSGSPTVDIGLIGLRGSQNSAFIGWKESAGTFVTALSNTTVSNTTVNINSYANLVTGNLTAQGTTSLVGNVLGTANFTGTINAGNLSTTGIATAASTVGGVITGSNVSVTGNVLGGNVISNGLISAGGNIFFSGDDLLTNNANLNFGSQIPGGYIRIGNLHPSIISIGGNTTNATIELGNTTSTVNIPGAISAPGNITAGNISATNHTGTNVSVTGTVTAASVVGGVITGSSVSVTGSQTAASTVGGVITGTSTSVTGTQTAASTVGGVITGSSVGVTGNVSATGNVIAAWLIGNIQGNVNAPGANTEIIFNDSGVSNATSGFTFNKTSNTVTVGGNVDATNFNGNVFGTSVSASGTVTAASTVGGVITGSSTSVTGTQTAASTVGGVITGSSTSVTGTQTAASTVGGVITGSSTSVTGTQTAASTVGGVITGSSTSVTGTQTAASTVGGVITGSSVSVTGNVTGGNLVSATVTNPTAMTVSTNAGNINIEPTGNIVVNNTYINGVLNPVQNQDVATKIYVDNAVTTAISYHEAVVAATNTTLATITGGTVTYAQPNGVANGVGATLTTTGSFNLIDTANVQTVGTRILVKDQANAVQNGVYVYSNATVITRSSDTDTYAPASATALSINDYFFVSSGNVNAGSAWIVDSPSGTITFGTSNISFAQFSSSQTYTANTSAGLSLTGTVFSAKVDNNTTAFDGFGNISVKAGANLTTPNIGAATGTSLSVTGSVTAASTVGGVITGSNSSVTGTQTAASTVGGVITGSSVSVTGNVDASNTNSNVYGTSVSASGTVTAASTVGGVITGTSTSVTGTQTAASTVGGVITGSSTSVTGTQTAASTVGGVITGSSSSVTGTQTAASTVGGVITGSSASLSGNVTGGNILSGGSGSFTGNVTAANFFGNISGNIDAAGANTQVQFNDTGDILGASAGFTFDKTANLLTVTGNVAGGNVTTGGQVSATANVTGGNVLTGGLISATANITGGNVLTGGLVSATANVTGGNVLTGGQFISTGTGSSTTGSAQLYLNGAGNNRIDWNTNGTGAPAFTTRSAGTKVTLYPALSGSTTDYALGIDSATMWSSIPEATAGFNFKWYGATTQVGSLSGTGNLSVTGNVTGANILTGGLISATGNVTGANLILTSGVIDGPAAGRITVNGSDIDTDFAVDGDTLANVFYVDAGTGTASFGSSTQVTNAIVNFDTTTSFKTPVGNTAQRPATGVTGMQRFNTTTNALEIYNNSEWQSVGATTFTVIADQQFNGDGATVAFTLGSTQTTNSCIVSINGVVQIPTIAYSVSGTNPTCVLTFTEAPATGDLIDVRQITTTTTTVTSIANSSGNAVVSVTDTAAQVNVTGDLSVSGSILGGNINSTAITFGNSNMAVVSSGGNIRGNVAGTTVMTISPGLVDIVGNLTVSGNATLSGNILGDRIQNGTTSFDIQTASGNANITIGGTSNTAVFGPTALTLATNLLPSANITYDLGTTTQRWKDLWLSNSTIYMGNAQISANATSLIFTNPQGGQTVLAGASSAITGATVSVTGNITGNYLFGNGSQLTGIDATSIQNGTSSVSVIASGGNVRANIAGATVTTTYASGLAVTGLVSATGTVTGASVVGGVITGSSTSVTGTTTAASVVGGVITGSSVSVTGTINGTTLTGTSLAVSTGNITGGNLILSGSITDSGQLDIQTTASNGNIVLTPNGTGNVNTGANISVTGRVTAASIVGGVITGTSTSVTGAQTAASTVGGVITGSSVSVTGNITGGNVNTGGNVTGNWMLPTTGMSTGGNVLVGGYLSVVGNLYVSNVISSQTLTVDDPLLYLVANVTFPYNYDIGFYSAFTGGAGNTYQHTGVVRDYTDNTWKIVSNVPEPAGSAFDFDNAIYDPVKHGNLAVVGNGTFTTTVSATGTITGGNIATAGAITGASASVSGTVTGASHVGSVVSVTGAITGASVVGGVITGSSTSVTGTTTAASVVGGVITGSSVSVTGTINGTTLTGTGLTVTTGNITGGNLILSGSITDSGQLDITTTASNGNIVLTPNGTGNVNTGANISVTGRVTAASVVGGVITGSSTSVTGAQTAASTVGGVITGSSTSVTGTTTAASVVGGVITGTSVSVSGSVTGGAHNGTSVSVSGGVTAASVAGGVITGTSASVTGAVTQVPVQLVRLLLLHKQALRPLVH